MRRLTYLCLSGLIMITAVACTLQEWEKVATDAVTDAPAALTDIITNPTPSNVGIVVAAFIAGLVSKSAARGFGKGAKYASTSTVSIISTILSALGRKK